MNSILIKNGQWLHPAGKLISSNLLLQDGHIVDLDAALQTRTDQKIDAAGQLILPGAIDPHVHFREPGQLYKEGIVQGGRAALKGGVTTVIDMPNNIPPCTTAKRLEEKKALFRKKALVNWGLMLHTRNGNYQYPVSGVMAAKVYMAKSSGLPAVNKTGYIENILRQFPVVAFHAEDESFFISDPAVVQHHEKRPRQAVTGALVKIEEALRCLPADIKPNVVICHMNTADELFWLERMRREGFKVFGETAPHYLYFTQEDYLRDGAVFKVNPAIRSAQDQSALRAGLASGRVDFIGTDHAPHPPAEKNGTAPPSGIAGIEWLTPLMLNFVDSGQVSWLRYQQLMTENAAKAYRIAGRDGIRQGNFGDLVLVQKLEAWQPADEIVTHAATNPFTKITLHYKVTLTLVNGIIKYNGSEFFEQARGMEIGPAHG